LPKCHEIFDEIFNESFNKKISAKFHEFYVNNYKYYAFAVATPVMDWGLCPKMMMLTPKKSRCPRQFKPQS